MKRGLIIFLLIGTFLVSGCSGTLITQGCYRDSCDPLFASCNWGDGSLDCPAVERLGSVCGQYYSCEMSGVHCVVKKLEKYDECVECFTGAETREDLRLCSASYTPLE